MAGDHEGGVSPSSLWVESGGMALPRETVWNFQVKMQGFVRFYVEKLHVARMGPGMA